MGRMAQVVEHGRGHFLSNAGNLDRKGPQPPKLEVAGSNPAWVTNHSRHLAIAVLRLCVTVCQSCSIDEIEVYRRALDEMRGRSFDNDLRRADPLRHPLRRHPRFECPGDERVPRGVERQRTHSLTSAFLRWMSPHLPIEGFRRSSLMTRASLLSMKESSIPPGSWQPSAHKHRVRCSTSGFG